MYEELAVGEFNIRVADSSQRPTVSDYPESSQHITLKAQTQKYTYGGLTAQTINKYN